MTDSENLNVVIKARGGREAAAQVEAMNKALERTGKVATSTRIVLDKTGDSTRRTQSRMNGAIGTTLRYAGAFLLIQKSFQAFGAGFNFDATMESNTIAFKHFLGSAQAANQEVQTLFTIAAKTPFEFKDIATTTRRFLAFGFSVADANKELGIIGDAIAGMGGGAEQINQLSLALGQIKAKGHLQGDELLQLTELGIIGPQQIAAQLGMTNEAFQKAVTANKISSDQAITAINDVLTKTFAGSAAEQAKTFTGQLSTIKDYGSQAAGALVKPLFDLAKSGVMPKIAAGLQHISKSLNAGGAQQLYHYLGLTLKIIAPLLVALALYKSAVLAVAAAEAAWAGVQAAIALGATLLAVLALIPAVSTLADAWVLLDAATYANPFVFIAAAIIALIAGIVYLFVKWGWFHRAVVNTLKVIGQVFSTIWDIIKAMVDGIKAAVGFFAHPFGKGGILGGHGVHLPSIKLPFMADGGTIPVGGSAVVGEAGAEVATNTGHGTRVTPMGGGGGPVREVHHQPIQMDGRVVAEIIFGYGQTAQARA